MNIEFHLKYKDTDDDFELTEDLKIKTLITGFISNTKYVSIDIHGNLYIRKGFKWNASGPTIDSLNTREATCYHDALYELSNHSAFKLCSYRIRLEADDLLYKTLRENGMWWIRAQVWHKSVRMCGGSYWETNKKRYKGMYK